MFNIKSWIKYNENEELSITKQYDLLIKLADDCEDILLELKDSGFGVDIDCPVSGDLGIWISIDKHEITDLSFINFKEIEEYIDRLVEYLESEGLIIDRLFTDQKITTIGLMKKYYNTFGRFHNLDMFFTFKKICKSKWRNKK